MVQDGAALKLRVGLPRRSIRGTNWGNL